MNRKQKIYMLTGLSFVVGTSQFVIVGVLDQLAQSLHISLATAGQLVTSFALANAVGSPLLMMAMARRSGRSQLLFSLLLVIIGVGLTVTELSYAMILLGRAVLGIGSGTFVAVSYTLAAGLAEDGKRAQAMANISMGFSASLVFGVPLGRMLTAWYDWKAVFWILGVLSIVGLLGVWRYIEAQVGEAPLSLREQLRVVRRRPILITLGRTLIVFAGYSAVNTYITPLLLFLGVADTTAMSFVLLGLGVASLIGSKSGGRMADAWGTQRTLLVAMGIQAVALGGIVIGMPWLWLSVVCLLLWAWFAWVFGLTQSVTISALAPTASGIVLTVNSAIVQLGFAFGAFVGGRAVGGGNSVTEVALYGAVAAIMGMVLTMKRFVSEKSA